VIALQELKNAALFYTVGLPLVIILTFVWGAVTEIAGYIAVALMVIYPLQCLYRKLREKARA